MPKLPSTFPVIPSEAPFNVVDTPHGLNFKKDLY